MNGKTNLVSNVKFNQEENKQNEIQIETLKDKLKLDKDNLIGINNEKNYHSNSQSNKFQVKDKLNNIEKDIHLKIKEILLKLYHNIDDNNEQLLKEENQFQNELKISCNNLGKSYSILVLKILLDEMIILIDIIEDNLDYQNIDLNDLLNIKNSLIKIGNASEKIFEPLFNKIGKNFDIKCILIGIFTNVICDDERIKNNIEENDYQNLKSCKDENEYEKFEEYIKNENIINEGNFYDQNEYNDDEEEKENDLKININENENKKNNKNNKESEQCQNMQNIDDLLDFINDGENIKKNKKKKKKSKKNKNENLIEVNDENLNESDDNDPIVDNFKKSLIDFSFNDNNKKIRPKISEKWITKIQRMSN
jgi:hypothetical protein